jgi:hypothetical protein
MNCLGHKEAKISHRVREANDGGEKPLGLGTTPSHDGLQPLVSAGLAG